MESKHSKGSSSASDDKRPAKGKAEKRLKRFRSKPTIGITSRIERAIHQRLFLVQTSPPTTCRDHGGPSMTLTVLGSTGNVYDVTISKIPRCSCPDHAKGNLCKHLLFVMLKVVGLPVSSNLVYQSAYVTEELECILNTLQGRTARLGRDVVANEAVRQRLNGDMKKPSCDAKGVGDSSSTNRKEVEGGECPICFDDLGSNLSLLTYCQQTCGTNFHSECMKMWTKQASQRNNPTCPACRQPWADVNTMAAGGKRKAEKREGQVEGYDNLGALQGQSSVRDTSTYSPVYDGYSKRRRY